MGGSVQNSASVNFFPAVPELAGQAEYVRDQVAGPAFVGVGWWGSHGQDLGILTGGGSNARRECLPQPK
ncbi:hypothetical protein CesoFtcFv8_000835 [Champsocephalus esox]|uniref:Uncharacterized protein n=1 Tax=Champsocephalus esox TaxID=159716 RepID=A0AAN8D4M8_9TELE|nr:hypothetical protein CesoFtcFv8_000835 [Champsocephalus esox]